MSLVWKLVSVPFMAYFLLLPVLATLYGFLDRQEVKELMGGTNAMPLWFVLMGGLVFLILTHHFFRNKFKKTLDTDEML